MKTLNCVAFVILTILSTSHASANICNGLAKGNLQEALETAQKNNKAEETVNSLLTLLTKLEAHTPDPSAIETYNAVLYNLQKLTLVGENLLKDNDFRLDNLRISVSIEELKFLGGGLIYRFQEAQKMLVSIQKRLEDIRSIEDGLAKVEKDFLQAYAIRNLSALHQANETLSRLDYENLNAFILTLNTISDDLIALRWTIPELSEIEPSVRTSKTTDATRLAELSEQTVKLLSDSRMGLIELGQKALAAALEKAKEHNACYVLENQIYQRKVWPETEPEIISKLRTRTR